MKTRISRPCDCAIRSPTCPGSGSTVSIAQPASPTAENENRSSLGGISLTRARLSAPRSDPYHGLPRPPFTALRVVAARIVGLAESREASKREPAARLAQPPSARAAADEASARSIVRREATASDRFRLITRSPWNFLGEA